jgi:hypothetical protein
MSTKAEVEKPLKPLIEAEQPQPEKKPLWQLDVTPLDQSRFPDDEGL